MFTTMILFFFVQNIILGAIFGRLDGGGILNTPGWVERFLIMLYFVLACLPYAGWASPLAFIGVAGIVTGHGMYFLSLSAKAVKPEWFDFVVRPFFGEDPRAAPLFVRFIDNEFEMSVEQRDEIQDAMNNYGLKKLYRRCVFGMFVTGSIVGLPAALLCLCFGAWLPALLLSLTGVVKAAAYVIAHRLFQSTVQAEYGNGGARTALALAAFLLFFFH